MTAPDTREMSPAERLASYARFEFVPMSERFVRLTIDCSADEVAAILVRL